MPTRSNYNHSANHPVVSSHHSNQFPTNTTSTNSTVGDIHSYIGKPLTINQHQVIVEDILGQGGFAFVFLVRSSNQQRYALKRMYVNNERDLIVCQREINILKEFSSHPNIVKYVDSFIQRLVPPTQSNSQKKHLGDDVNDHDDDDVEEDAIFEILLLTEYCSHGSLITRLNEQRLSGTPLNERQILRVFADICHAVSALHYRRPQPILHRDIKLENILIDSHQSFVLCDFGSAILLPSSSKNDHQQYQSNQLTTQIIQQIEEDIQRYTTLSYRAPELIDLYSRLPITLKVDIWALGCLLYKLMYNVMPFGDSILAIQNGTFLIPDEMAQMYSRELNIFLRYMLEIDISKRPDIWQVSYIAYKLLGVDCPIPNRYQSKMPDLSAIPVPLTESESRHQRSMALANAKPTSTNVSDDASTLGTAVNPRERPRGIAAPSAGLINFNQPTQRSAVVAVPPPLTLPPPTISNPVPTGSPAATPSRPSHQRCGSAAQLMFDDDFSQFPTHALSLTNIANTATLSTTPKSIATPERNVSRARPSPPSSISTASGLAIQQQLFPPPPFSSDNTQSNTAHHQHRRSASQTISPAHNQLSFPPSSSTTESNPSNERRHSIDSSIKQPQGEVLFIGEASDDDDDAADALASNLTRLKVHNHSTENVKSRESLILNEDDRLFAKTYTINSQLKSDDEQTSSSSSSPSLDDTKTPEKSNRKTKKKSQSSLTPLRSGHYATTDETDKNTSSPSTSNKNLVKRFIERCSLQQQQQQSDDPTASSTPYKRKDSFTLSSEHPIPMGDQSDDHSDSDNDSDDDDDDDDDDDRGDDNYHHHRDNNNVGFDQLINEDSDDDGDDQMKHSINKTSSNPTTKLFNLFTTNSKPNPSHDFKRTINEHNNQTNSSFIDNDNPFLHAPFHFSHRSPTHKQASQMSSIPTNNESTTTTTTSTLSAFDPTSIVVGKRLSAFAPYQRQESNSNQPVDPNTNAFKFGVFKPTKISHSESYPLGMSNSTHSNNQASISKDVFTNAPFKPKSNPKPPVQQQQQQQRLIPSNKTNTISPTSSHSTSSSNSQLIDLTVPASTNVDSTIREPLHRSSPPRRPVGSAALASHFGNLGTINSTNDTYYFHSDRGNNDGHSSSEELTSSSSSTRKRTKKKKSSATTNANTDSQQHAYANLSFNDTIVDEYL